MTMDMKRSVIYILCLLALNTVVHAQINRNAVYKALSSGDEAIIDKEIAKLESEKTSSRNNAYSGALTMKKAGFQKGVNAKVKTFKKGARLLEQEIKNDPDDTEFRFLRLTVQEHAPPVLKYNKQLNEDKEAVVAGYAGLSAELKGIVKEYTRDSKILKESDLK